MSGDADRLSFLDRPLPAAFALRVVGLARGSERPYDEAEWRDALVVVERGELELEGLAGGRRRFGPGDVLCLTPALRLRLLRQCGANPVLLVAVSRRGDTSAATRGRLRSRADERRNLRDGMGGSRVDGGMYIDANGVHTYFEVSGTGEPLVLVHGGFGGVHSWVGLAPLLAERYRVYVPEQRGRGHTPDADGPIGYQLLAEDTIAFIEREVGTPAFVVGASDGGIIGLLIAMQRPDLLRKLVAIGANFHRDGLIPGSMWTDASHDDEAWARPRQRYEEVSPDGPDHFPVVLGKLQRMWRTEPTLTTKELGRIEVPVLVMAGDDDAVLPTHTLALYEALPQGQLAIIPGASHAVFMEKPELVAQLITGFMSEERPPETILPIRRA